MGKDLGCHSWKPEHQKKHLCVTFPACQEVSQAKDKAMTNAGTSFSLPGGPFCVPSLPVSVTLFLSYRPLASPREGLLKWTHLLSFLAIFSAFHFVLCQEPQDTLSVSPAKTLLKINFYNGYINSFASPKPLPL